MTGLENNELSLDELKDVSGGARKERRVRSRMSVRVSKRGRDKDDETLVDNAGKFRPNPETGEAEQ